MSHTEAVDPEAIALQPKGEEVEQKQQEAHPRGSNDSIPPEWWKMALNECFGTAVLVLVGCGSATTNDSSLSNLVTDILSISMAFGIAIIAMAYSIGNVSGCHVNPAVTLGITIAGRMSWLMLAVYWAAQFIGGIIGAGVLYGFLISKAQHDAGINEYDFGANGWGAYTEGGDIKCYGACYDTYGAMWAEIIFTFIFLVVILGVTGKQGNNKFAGLAIGFTLVGIHVVTIPITGTSVNPARSLGPAIFAGGLALEQVWLFFVGPLIGAALAGICNHPKIALFELTHNKND